MKLMKKKVIFIIMALVMISVTCFAALSFTLADVPGDTQQAPEAVESADEVVKTNIDYIVEKASPSEPYAIVEIGSSSTPSALQSMVQEAEKKFENLVINGYSVTGDMKADSISYAYYYFSSDQWYCINAIGNKAAAVEESDVVSAVSHADFLYVSNDPDKIYDKSNDIPEAVKIALSSAATGTYTPMMIDSHEKTIINQKTAALTINTLASQIFRGSGSSYATFSFDGTKGAGDLMNLAVSSRSFSKIMGNNQIANGIWQSFPKGTVSGTTFTPDENAAPYYVAKILSVGTGTSNFTTSLKTGLSAVTAKPADIDPNAVFDTTNLFAYTDSATIQLAYYNRYEKPDFVRFETVAADALSTVDLESYDFVIFEDGTGSTTLTEDDYNAAQAAMIGNVHILYDEKLATQAVISGNGGLSDAANYNYVYNKVATATGSARFGNILVLSRAKTEAYAMATKPKTVKAVADIIINGSFRGIKGNDSGDSASNVYTVLEIEPAYPIDTTLAAQLGVVKGWEDPDSTGNVSFAAGSARNVKIMGRGFNSAEGYYFIRTASTSNQTADEISFNGTTPLSEMLESGDYEESIVEANKANITDYYKWTLSKAKVAHATGKNYNEVNVVHMSSIEFNSSKKTLIDNYDAIFIGGDTSGIKPARDWTNNTEMYRMYFHNGDTYSYPSGNYGYMFGYNGALAGNDITGDKKRELLDYLAAGMPIIITDDVTAAYNNGGADHMIDPSSNMCAFLKVALDPSNQYVPGANDSGNVISNFDDVVIRVPNVDNQYGITYGGYATVFAGVETEDYKGADVTKNDPNRVDEQQLSLLLAKVSRPKLAVTSMPKTYVEGDQDSWVSSSDLVFKYEASGGTGSFKAELFYDENSNSRFDDETAKDTVNGKTGTLSGIPSDPDFFGPLYWKVKVTDTKTGAACSVTGLSKVKRTTQDKMRVELLEIVPDSQYMNTSDNDWSTLFLCTECQQASMALDKQRWTSVGKYSKDAMVGLSSGFKTSDPGNNTADSLVSTDDVVSMIQKDDSSYSYPGGKTGVHSHKFGIAKYDEHLDAYDEHGVGGLDDWNDDWFDEVTQDYDVDVTIMSTSMFDELCGRVNNYYASYYNSSDSETANMEALTNARASFYADKSKYFKLYQAMTKLINGEISSGSEEYSLLSDWFTSVGADSSLMTLYATAGPSLDDYLKNTIYPAYESGDFKPDKVNDEKMKEEIEFETSDSISYSRRSYYDFFSLANAVQSYGSYYAGFCDIYRYWRDAKIVEQYFRQKYMESSYMSGVNFDFTDNSKNDKSYPALINLSNTFNCICIGAAYQFGGDGDISVRGCNALLDYADDGGSVFLFNDSITPGDNSTSNMSVLLRTFFGQNNRHDYLNDENGRTKIDHNFTVTVDGQSFDYTMTSGKESAEIQIGQNAGSITATQNSVTFSTPDGTSYNMPAGFSNSTAGYNYEFERTEQNVAAVTLGISCNGWNNASEGSYNSSIVKELNISPAVTDVVIDCKYGSWNGDNPSATLVSSSGMNLAPHNINIKFNIYSRINESNRGRGWLYRISGGAVASVDDGQTVTASSTNTGSGTSRQITYEKTGETPVAGTLSGNGQQVFTVHMTNSANGSAVAGETINYVVNGTSGSVKTDTSGNAVFTRTNYAVSGITSDVTSETTLTGDWTKNQAVTFIYKDVNGDPVVGKTISVFDATTSETYSVTTNAEGKASLSGLYNYTVNSSASFYDIDQRGTDGDDYYLSPSSRNLTPVTLTNGYVMTDSDSYTGGAPTNNQFLYNYIGWKSNVPANNQNFYVNADERGFYDGSHIPTDRAEQNNEGIVTLYPFNIGSNLKIANTLSQGFALDTEDPDLVCYYSLAGGNQGTVSSQYSADPHDGTNNYFIYQKGTVTYTGAGHGNVTGRGRNNNDERRLFINVILNSARKSTAGTSLKLYDVTSTYDGKDTKTLTNDVVKEDETGLADYFITITDTSSLPTFSFLPKTDTASGVSVQSVRIYYDLDHDDEYVIARDSSGNKIYDEDANGKKTIPRYLLDSAGNKIPCKNIYSDTYGDVLIFTSAADSARNIGSNLLRRIDHNSTDMFGFVGLQNVLTQSGVTTSALNLKPEYFNELGYCYIVVEVTDSKNNTIKKTIRLSLSPELQHLN